jgi:hypothetical protein
MDQTELNNLSKKQLIELVQKYQYRSSNKERILFNVSMVLSDLKNNINSTVSIESHLEIVIDTIDSVLDYE